MARAYVSISNREDMYLQDTRVENLFISEFLPAAPEGYVKVYLFGLMYAQNNISMDTDKLSRVLGIPEQDIVRAWLYWQEKGLVCVKRSSDNPDYGIEYLSLVDSMYGRRNRPAGTKRNTASFSEIVIDPDEEDAIARVVNQEIQAIYNRYEELIGRTLSPVENKKIADAIESYNILPDVMFFAVEYCAEKRQYSVYDIVRTAINWAKEGCTNLAEVKEYLDARSKRNQYYDMVFHEMGWVRKNNPGDREIMDRWFDEWGCSIRDVLDACRAASGLRDPSLKYVNKVLENRRLEAGGINTRSASTGTRASGGSEASAEPARAMVSRKVLREYYDYIRQEGEKELDVRIDEACERIIELRDVFDLENKLNAELMSTTFASGTREQKQALRAQRKALEEDKRRYLKENGYNEDFLVRRYRCSICKDTGITDDGRICTCSEARAREAYKWNQERNH